jgi:hypothetical protein
MEGQFLSCKILPSLKDEKFCIVDLAKEAEIIYGKTTSSSLNDNPMKSVQVQEELLTHLQSKYNTKYTIGGYLEDRSKLWKSFENSELMLHLGVDINNLHVGDPVSIPVDGTVVHVMRDMSPMNGWGGRLIFELAEPWLASKYLLYGHLSHDLPNLGQTFKGGEVVGRIGDESKNGGWFIHLHVQLITEKMFKRYEDCLDKLDGYYLDSDNISEITASTSVNSPANAVTSVDAVTKSILDRCRELSSDPTSLISYPSATSQVNSISNNIRWIHMSQNGEDVREYTPQVPYVSDLDENGQKKEHLRRISDRGWSIYPCGMFFSPATCNERGTASEWVEHYGSLDSNNETLKKNWVAVYEATDLDKLRLARFDQENFLAFTQKYYTDKAQILPPMIDWELVAQDYDGIIVDPSPVYLINENGNQRESGRWSYFARSFDVMTLVIWRHLKVKSLGTSDDFLANYRISASN